MGIEVGNTMQYQNTFLFIAGRCDEHTRQFHIESPAGLSEGYCPFENDKGELNVTSIADLESWCLQR